MADPITSSEEVLKDAAMVQPEGNQGQDITPVPETPAPLEIGSLGEAMQAFNAAKSKAVEPGVSEGEPEGEPNKPSEPLEGDAGAAKIGSTASVEQAIAADDQGSQPVLESAGTAELYGGAGEPTGYDEVYDVDAGIADVRQDLIGIAVDAVRKDFAAKKINKISINDLVKVDERSGTKEFINPDTGRSFSSSNPRSEAQAFVRDYNAELESQFNQQCRQLLPEIERSYAPLIQFHEFIPKWQQMDPFRQEMFEELVAGHELTDKNGDIVAYDCDLNAIHNQMERQIQWLLSKQQNLSGGPAPAAAEDPVRRPAVAAKAKVAASSGDDKEYDLSNMNDALKFFNSQKKKGK